MNNKGQVLALFVVLLPIFLIVCAIVVDLGMAEAKKNELESVAKTTISYGLKHQADPDVTTKMEQLVKANLPQVNDFHIIMTKDSIQINLYQTIDSNFGKIIGIKKYDIIAKQVGSLNQNQKIVIRDVKEWK